eukprot:4286079-Alexandrium_andersonii.AAC.1
MSTQVKNGLSFWCSEGDYDLCNDCHRIWFKDSMQYRHGGAAGKPATNPAGAGAARSRASSSRT